jgi:UDP-glucose 4-epimerase
VQRALVLGGGLLGGHVAAALAERGHPTTVFTRSFNPWLLEHHDRWDLLDLVEGIIAPVPQLAELIDDADVVYFMAGTSTPLHADQHTASSMLDSVATALTVLDLMRETSTRRVVLASSGGTVYGEPDRLPTDEQQPLDPISIHGLNSLVTERYAEFFASRHGLEVTVLRYSNVYGPGQTGRRGQGVIATWCRALALGEPVTVFGDLGVRRDFVYASDAAAATVAAGLAPDALGTFNVGSGEGVTLGEVLDLVLEAAGGRGQVRQEPARGLDVSATALDCSRLASVSGWSATTPLAVGIGMSWSWVSHHLAVMNGAGAMPSRAPAGHPDPTD